MTAMVTVLLLAAAVVGVALLVGFAVGVVASRRDDNRRLNILADRLLTEQHIDATTRTTLAAMRQAARQFTGGGCER